MRAIDRRQFTALLIANLAAARAKMLAATEGRQEMFTLKVFRLPVGSGITAIAERTSGPDAGELYGVRAVVTRVRQIADGRWLWAVECAAGHDVHWFCGESVADAQPAAPHDAIAWARRRWAERDLAWPKIGT